MSLWLGGGGGGTLFAIFLFELVFVFKLDLNDSSEPMRLRRVDSVEDCELLIASFSKLFDSLEILVCSFVIISNYYHLMIIKK